MSDDLDLVRLSRKDWTEWQHDDARLLIEICDRLRSQLAMKDKALRGVEFVARCDEERVWTECPCCRNGPLGHTPDCLIALALANHTKAAG